MPAPKTNHVLAGKSAREIIDYKQKLGCELRVQIYALIGDKFIIAPLDGTQGLYIEEREVTILPFDIADETLGCCICDNLLWNITPTPANLRDKKSSDWPAFKASGFKALSHFQQTAIHISVSTLNTILRIETRPVHSLDKIYIGVELSQAALHIEIAAQIHHSLKAVTALQDANLL